MNRTLRRAGDKRQRQTHKLTPHYCVLWLPQVRAFLGTFTAEGFTTESQAAQAHRFCEHIASNVAVTIRERFRMRVVVRPFYSDLEEAGRGDTCDS